MARIYLTLSSQEHEALRMLSEIKSVGVRTLATQIIRQELEQQGLLPKEDRRVLAVGSIIMADIMQKVHEINELFEKLDDRNNLPDSNGTHEQNT